MAHIADVWCVRVWPQGKLVGRVFEWLLPQPVDDCLRVLASCMLGGAEVTPLMCSTTETIGNASGDGEEDTVRARMHAPACLIWHWVAPPPTGQLHVLYCAPVLIKRRWPAPGAGY